MVKDLNRAMFQGFPSIVLALVLFIGIVGAKHVPYKVTIWSSDDLNPNDQISIAFYGMHKNTVHKILPLMHKKLQGKNEATFVVSAEDVEAIEQMKIKRVVNGPKLDWHVNKITVRNMSGAIFEFLCKCVLSKEKGLEVTNTPMNVILPSAGLTTPSPQSTSATSTHTNPTKGPSSSTGGNPTKGTDATTKLPGATTQATGGSTGSNSKPGLTTPTSSSQKPGASKGTSPTGGSGKTTPVPGSSTNTNIKTKPTTQAPSSSQKQGGTSPTGGSGETTPVPGSSTNTNIKTKPSTQAPSSSQKPGGTSPTGGSGETTPGGTSPTGGSGKTTPVPGSSTNTNIKTKPTTQPPSSSQKPGGTSPTGGPGETTPSGTSPTGGPGETTPSGTSPTGGPGETTPSGTSPTGGPGESTPAAGKPTKMSTSGSTAASSSSKPTASTSPSSTSGGTSPSKSQASTASKGSSKGPSAPTESPPTGSQANTPTITPSNGPSKAKPPSLGNLLGLTPQQQKAAAGMLENLPPNVTEKVAGGIKEMNAMLKKDIYIVKIESQDNFNQGDIISIQFIGKNGSKTDFKVLENAFQKFQGKPEADFNITAKDVGEIERIALKRKVNGPKAEWYVHKIFVQDRHSKIYEFLCKCPVAKDTGTIITDSPTNIVDIYSKSGNEPSTSPTVGTEPVTSQIASGKPAQRNKFQHFRKGVLKKRYHIVAH